MPALPLPHPRSTPREQLPEALTWERLLVERATAAGSAPALVYNVKLGSASDATEAGVGEAVARLQHVLNSAGTIPHLQLPLSDEAASDALAGFLQRAAAAARQRDVPKCLPEQFLSGEGQGSGSEARDWCAKGRDSMLRCGLKSLPRPGPRHRPCQPPAPSCAPPSPLPPPPVQLRPWSSSTSPWTRRRPA